MKSDVFRQKSIEKLNKPDELDKCIHIIPPSVWLVLAAVLVFLIGMCVWGVFGVIRVETSLFAYSENNVVCIYQPVENSKPVTKNTECFLSDGTPIVIDKAAIRGRLSDFVAASLATTDENDLKAIENLFVSGMSFVYPGTDFDEAYISVGRASADIDDGWIVVKAVLDDTNLYKLMFDRGA